MKNLKRKLAVIACAAMLIVLAVGGSTIAYFTDTDEVVNTFTYGSVTVDQQENGGNEPVNKPNFLPIVNTAKPTDDPNYVEKDIIVKNTSETTDAYIRTFIAVPSKLYTSGALHLVFENGFSDAWTLSGKYERYMGESAEQNKYIVFAYTYTGTNTTEGYQSNNGKVAAGNQTISLLKGVYTDAKADVRVIDGKQHVIMWNTAVDVSENNYEDTGYVLADERQFNIYVNTQAVQADGFDSPENAFTAAFGNKDPWGTELVIDDTFATPAEVYNYN